jgi:DNA-binding MarR family transcriptional regulator
MGSPCYCSSLRLAARKATALYDAALAPVGINVAQFALLRRIEGVGSASLTDLGRLAALDRSTVGRNVKVLERRGLVRLASAEDQREAAVTLTSAGDAALRRGAPLWEAAQSRVEAVLGVDGAGWLRALVRHL